MINIKPIAFISGTLICATGFFLFLPLLTEIIYQNDQWQAYTIPIILYLIVGGSLVIINKDVEIDIDLKSGFFITVFSWILLSLICAIPFMYAKSNLHWVDALFESMSGLTTTGATILTNLDELPKGILIWRSFLQWVGGIGIIIIALFILPFLKVGGMQLFHSEGDDPYEKFSPKIASTVKSIFFVYLGITLISIILYILYGMSAFDAINHALTTISTGGFSTHDESFAFFNSTPLLFISSFIIILGSIPFILIAQSNLKNPFIIFRDEQVKIFLIILVIIIVTLYFLAGGYIEGDILDKYGHITFNTISIISGTGFISDNFENWGNYASILFLFLMFIGGCAGSTTSGLKIFRFKILFLSLSSHLNKLLRPHGIFTYKFNGKNIPDNTFESVMSFFFIFIITFVLASLLLSFSGLDFITCISASASAIANIGPGLGEIIGPNGNYSSLTDYSKIILTITMLLGRLEILTLVIFFLPRFWKN